MGSQKTSRTCEVKQVFSEEKNRPRPNLHLQFVFLSSMRTTPHGNKCFGIQKPVSLYTFNKQPSNYRTMAEKSLRTIIPISTVFQLFPIAIILFAFSLKIV